jgi:hypothetical protein
MEQFTSEFKLLRVFSVLRIIMRAKGSKTTAEPPSRLVLPKIFVSCSSCVDVLASIAVKVFASLNSRLAVQRHMVMFCLLR